MNWDIQRLEYVKLLDQLRACADQASQSRIRLDMRAIETRFPQHFSIDSNWEYGGQLYRAAMLESVEQQVEDRLLEHRQHIAALERARRNQVKRRALGTFTKAVSNAAKAVEHLVNALRELCSHPACQPVGYASTALRLQGLLEGGPQGVPWERRGPYNVPRAEDVAQRLQRACEEKDLVSREVTSACAYYAHYIGQYEQLIASLTAMTERIIAGDESGDLAAAAQLPSGPEGEPWSVGGIRVMAERVVRGKIVSAQAKLLWLQQRHADMCELRHQIDTGAVQPAGGQAQGRAPAQPQSDLDALSDSSGEAIEYEPGDYEAVRQFEAVQLPGRVPVPQPQPDQSGEFKCPVCRVTAMMTPAEGGGHRCTECDQYIGQHNWQEEQ